MEMKDFITRASTLKNFIDVRPRTFSSVGILENCGGIRVNRVECGDMTLDKKYKEIDALVKQCKALIERYGQISDIISDNAAKKAGEKSGVADRIKNIEAKRSDIQGEIDTLASKVMFFDKRKKACSDENDRLRKKREEIEKREKSGYEFIPFYGIKYAVDTYNMVSDYNRDVARNNVLRAEINNDRKSYDDDRHQADSLKQQMNELSAEMEALRKKFGEVIEVLHTLSCLIASMGDFITAVGGAKSALQYSFFEDINKAQTAIDRTISRIDSYHDVFCQKLTEISGQLDRDAYGKIMKLAG